MLKLSSEYFRQQAKILPFSAVKVFFDAVIYAASFCVLAHEQLCKGGFNP